MNPMLDIGRNQLLPIRHRLLSLSNCVRDGEVRRIGMNFKMGTHERREMGFWKKP